MEKKERRRRKGKVEVNEGGNKKENMKIKHISKALLASLVL